MVEAPSVPDRALEPVAPDAANPGTPDEEQQEEDGGADGPAQNPGASQTIRYVSRPREISQDCSHQAQTALEFLMPLQGLHQFQNALTGMPPLEREAVASFTAAASVI